MFAKATETTRIFFLKVNVRLILFVILLVMIVIGAGAPGATGV
jgi:hypothetical protein